MKRFIYNPETLTYDKVTPKYKVIGIWSVILLLLAFCIGSIYGRSQTENKMANVEESADDIIPSKHDVVIGTTEWKDSVFLDYRLRADAYLSRDEFKGSPIKGEFLALAAHNAYDSTGILLPVELCLAQCQWESGMGMKGKSPKNNPFNIGEYDSGTVMWFDSPFEGTQAYFYFMCNDYLACHSLGELFTNFVNCDGKRYASGQYEEHVPKQYYFIKKWLAKNYDK